MSKLSSARTASAADAGGSRAASPPMTIDGVAALAGRFGFSHYLLATFPRGDQVGFAENLMVSNWPAELAEKYAAGDLFRVSTLVAKLKTTVLPVFSDSRILLRGENYPENLDFSAMLVREGLAGTLAFSTHDADLTHWIVALSGQREAPSTQESMEIVYGMLTALDFSAASRRLPVRREKLTAREIECLRWSAAGKSSEEIAIILAISSHTVVSYLKSAMRKLDSVNRMQAIARACRYRLL